MISHRGPNKLISLAPAHAGIHIRASDYLRRNPGITRDLYARLFVLLAGLVFWQWPLMLIGVLLLLWPVIRFRRVARVMRQGSPCAAKIISLNPPLVACIAEMSRALNVSHPTLVIMRANLLYESDMAESGDRIALVGLPLGGLPNKAESLEAYVVSTVCDEPPGLLLDAVAEWHWDDLEDGLFRVAHPYSPGVYPLS